MPGVRQSFPGELSPRAAPQRPQRGEALRVQGVREALWSPVTPDRAPETALPGEVPKMYVEGFVFGNYTKAKFCFISLVAQDR